MREKLLSTSARLVAVLALVTAVSARGDYNIIHSFSADTDGSNPLGTLVQAGPALYGMTFLGGPGGLGTIFTVNADGSGFNVLHDFTGSPTDGSIPFGSLTRSGNELYGMTFGGGEGSGVGSGGTVFKINMDGTGFTLLHSFMGGTTDGAGPQGSLTISGSSIYGIVGDGGATDNGAVFTLNTDGSGFNLLHSFNGADGIARVSYGPLLLSGSSLIGMTNGGGSALNGTIFKLNTDGSNFGLLHSFTGGSTDGTFPAGSLIQSGSTLFGTTTQGGSADQGTLFAINADGSGFNLSHAFTGGTADGSSPNHALIQDGNTLLGMSYGGGASGDGTLFQIGTDGSNFNILHSFAGGPADGNGPFDSLIQSGSTFYGMTEYGGATNNGTIFSLTVPEPASLSILGTTGMLLLNRRVRRECR